PGANRFLWKGFLLALYHALWQSAYHGLVAAIAQKTADPPYLELVFEQNSVRIINRALAAQRESKQTNDEEFFELFRRRLEGVLHISAPSPDTENNKPTWCTEIRFIEAGKHV